MEIDLSEFKKTVDVRCIIGRFFDQLSEEDTAKLLAALHHEDISNAEIVEWLKRRNLITANESVRKHRTSRCRCD